MLNEHDSLLHSELAGFEAILRTVPRVVCCCQSEKRIPYLLHTCFLLSCFQHFGRFRLRHGGSIAQILVRECKVNTWRWSPISPSNLYYEGYVQVSGTYLLSNIMPSK
jgi:hypothetical protein